MGSYNSLEIGKRALLAQRLGLDLTSNNIANVNTPGYSRRTAIMTETTPLYTSGNFLGTGVMIDKLRTYREDFFDKEIRSSLSRKAGYESDEAITQKIGNILGEPSDNGINEMVGQLFNSFQELTLKPENISLREQTLGLAQSLVDRFHDTAQKLRDLRNDVVQNIDQKLNEVNSLIERIAKLNKNIGAASSQDINGAQTLVDQREDLLEQLSKIVNINVTQNKNATVNVFINGINIITAQVFSTVRMQEVVNSTNGEKTLQFVRIDGKNTPTNIINPLSGELASLQNNYNVTLDDKDTRGGFSIPGKLNEFADALVKKFNAVSVQGYGLDDTGTTPPMREFFKPIVGNATADSIELADGVKGQPRNIPLADAAGEPGNNKIGLMFANIALDTDFLNGTTPSEYYTTFLGTVASMAQDASNGKTTSSLVSEQLENQRESIIGVNLDEEAVNLIKYQKAFEASSRVVNVTSEILSTIVNLGR